ncbi:glycoside hydrolase family 9 protein [Photobacterium sp. GJ3]|uniref:glycoside hydrolase family 9 protein n=1 Tax=Photobacterium sp. GJ3 TaxID=2829502 RepID=UPI001B8B7530|nr:glycoside hydrolase family 9 protein [Photobacterium sp. GJ3]QUJ67927.1 glycoside hydrolase family 9 protein [Photobacterium sp. GJ3]
MQLLINQLGYERTGSKIAMVQHQSPLSLTQATLIRSVDQQPVMQLTLSPSLHTDQWHTGAAARIDFSDWQESGRYRIRCGELESPDFEIREGLLMQRTFSDVLHYFKSQRCGGKFEQFDHAAPLFGSQTRVDVHGGWYDASGDVSKYFSHLSYANYLNPQQTPMVVWNMLTALTSLHDDPAFADFSRVRLIEEALFGADFLLRMLSPQGYFYVTVFDKWSKSTGQREICSYSTQEGIKSERYQAGFRQGGGIAIAALAAAFRLINSPVVAQLDLGVQPNTDSYLAAAQTAYWHLKTHNEQYLDDGQENIIDEYCALLAAVELHKATQEARYLDEARHWADRLACRQQSDAQQSHFWSATPDGSRPYYHAAEAGLPVISLLQYQQVESEPERFATIHRVIENALRFELKITQEVANPFGYPRQYVKAVDGEKQGSFFIPHCNESGYWWQGENARLGSLAAMAYLAAPTVQDPQLKKQLHQYADQLLNWILGLNPFDLCMLDGEGKNNPDYLPHLGYFNAKGGICNGITSGFDNESDIAFNPDPQASDMLQNWRWGEQWIPHAAWYLLAIALQFKEYQHD